MNNPLRTFVFLLGLTLGLGFIQAGEARVVVGDKGSDDWAKIPVPAKPGPGMGWKLDRGLSVDFNAPNKKRALGRGWVDRYINGWRGPGLGEFSSDHSTIEDGKLVLRAERNTSNGRVFCGVASSTRPVEYPVFVEAKLQVSGLVLSSNFWMLSDDDHQEIDVVECYGSPKDERLANRYTTNYHMFERNPDNNAIIKDHALMAKHTLPRGQKFHEGFHRFGAYWKDPWTIEFFLDGKKVRTLERKDIYDPAGEGFVRPMKLILDLEDHDWRSRKGITPTDEELADEVLNPMYVDWVRVYKPVKR
ncbi:MAG: family 16 glycosylhydrolase [Planctomycetota bacterium]